MVCQILWNTSHVFVSKAVKTQCFCSDVVFVGCDLIWAIRVLVVHVLSKTGRTLYTVCSLPIKQENDHPPQTVHCIFELGVMALG